MNNIVQERERGRGVHCHKESQLLDEDEITDPCMGVMQGGARGKKEERGLESHILERNYVRKGTNIETNQLKF